MHKTIYHLMLSRTVLYLALLMGAILFVGPFVLAQNDTSDDACDPSALNQQIASFQSVLPTDFEDDADAALGNLFRLANLYQQIAIDCGYTPSEPEVNALITNTLSLADAASILAASAVGYDVEAILTELETVSGDSFTGQLLYNGVENALDGTALGCSGCHLGEVAPVTEGTWTRVVEERLTLPEFEDYTDVEYLVESILHPNYYLVEGYAANLMPTTYGQRMDIQQLADLVAYLQSQDQLPEAEE